MIICVLGAGVIGVSTAYALARLGHEVIVIDKGGDVATGASQANGAQLSYAYIDPLAGPDILKKIPSFLLGSDPGIRLGFSLAPAYLKWGLNFLRECNNKSLQKNLESRSKLAVLSQDALSIFESELPPDALSRNSIGKLVLASTEKELSNMRNGANRKRKIGVETTILSRAECLSQEPALRGWQSEIVGGDTSLDPIVYCQSLKLSAESKFGVQFKFKETIKSLERDNGGTFRVFTDQAEYDCDRVVICLGTEAQSTLNGHSATLPIFPMRGYSVTLPSKEPELLTSITDPKNKIVFTNIGNQIRIAGFMDANLNETQAQKRGYELLELAQSLWPSVADYEVEPNMWSHFRPMTPSGVPIIGRDKRDGVYLNLGHGSLGYTFAAGSAMKIADMIGHNNKND